MTPETLKRRFGIIKQQIRPCTFEVAPQGVDCQGFLIFKMIEKRPFGNAGSVGDVLDGTPVKAAGMQCLYRATG